MSDNSSSSSSSVPLHTVLSLPSICFSSRESNYIFTAFTAANILLILPVCILVLHLGHRRWRQRRPASTSHSDFITYHMVVMEMSHILASVVYCVGVYVRLARVMMVTTHVFFISLCGQMSLHSLTCVERYLAVAHPVTYRCLRNGGGGTRIRNVTVCCVWLLCSAQLSILSHGGTDVIVMVYFYQQVVSLGVVSFCSFAVLRILKRPGPGEGGGDRERVDQSKQKAFNTIMAIMGALLLRFGGCLVCTALYASPLVSSVFQCVVLDSSFWFCLPSSLVLPLLFLYRAGKLPCFRNNTESRQGSS